MKIYVALIAMLMVSCANAQHKIQFHSQNYIGVLGGERDAAFQFQTINGFQKKTWFGGLGTGVDYYYQRTIPLFLSLTKYLKSNKSTPYLSLDGGTNFIWDKSTGNVFNGFNNDGKFTPSLYYGAHVGYKAALKRGNGSLLMGVGYTAKRLKEKIKARNPCFNPPCPEYDEKYDYRFNRFSFKLGWMF